jgi:hypothetical protein
MPTICEYIWLDGKGNLRSKTMIIHKVISDLLSDFPEWTYDASSTHQADSDGTHRGDFETGARI